MKCRQVVRLVDDVAQGRAQAADRALVKEHVGHCAECAQALRDAEGLAALISETSHAIDLGEGFTRSTLRRIELDNVRPRTFRDTLEKIAGPAVGAIILAGAACLAIVFASPVQQGTGVGTGPVLASESATGTLDPSSEGYMEDSLTVLELAQAPNDDTTDPFADTAVIELSRAGASHYMVAGLGF